MHRVLEDGVRIQPDVPDGEIGGNSVYRSGAPRSMKMGTTLSPWRDDAETHHALQSANLRRPAILRYTFIGGCLPDFAGWAGYHLIAAQSLNHESEVACQFLT
jgi:hypothetical protein